MAWQQAYGKETEDKYAYYHYSVKGIVFYL